MIKQAVWRGNSVRVLAMTAKTVIIMTPLNVRLHVRAIELHEAGKRRKRLDSSKF